MKIAIAILAVVGSFSLSAQTKKTYDAIYSGVPWFDDKGNVVSTSSTDVCSKYPTELLKFLTPVLKKDSYTATLTVLGERWWWKEKSGRLSGSTGMLFRSKK